MTQTITMILAGGAGSRLVPLTADRAKPAVPFGGHYRIIDFALSNCLHSGLRQILVLPQYKSHSLMKHLRDGWSVFNPSLGEYVTPVPPQMRTSDSWYLGTADAIYQNLYLLERSGASRVVILSGDHIYRMDYEQMLRFHDQTNAMATVACMEVSCEEARGFGVMSTDSQHRVVAFDEKPLHPQHVPGKPGKALASMGIYVFDRRKLTNILRRDHSDTFSSHDFGRDILPHLIKSGEVCAYPFGGHQGRVSADRYWRNVGTIDSYYEANMDLLRPVPPIDLYQPDWPIRTATVQSPPARTCRGRDGLQPKLADSIISAGAILSGGTVVRSILSPNVRVDSGACVADSVLFNGVNVGAGARVSQCIVEKGVQIPPAVTVDSYSVSGVPGCIVSEQGVAVISRNFCDWHLLRIPPDAALRTADRVAVPQD